MEEEKNINIKFNILAIICIIIFSFAITPITLQNDTYYTIKIGEHILQNGIDMKDPFSWHENLPYTYPHWLYDVIIYLIYSISGFYGIYASTIIFTCILGIVLFATNKYISKNNLTSFILTLIALYYINDFIAARAQLITFILFVLEILFIEKYTKTSKKKYCIFLIIISLLITNLHVAVWPFFFVLFMPYIGEYLIANIRNTQKITKLKIKLLRLKIKIFSKISGNIEKTEEKINILKDRIARNKEIIKLKDEKAYKIKIIENKNVKILIFTLVICIFTGLITPLRLTPYTYLVKTIQGNTTQNISEHLPMVLAENIKEVMIILISLSILIFTDTKIRLKDLFMLAGLITLSIITRRQFSMLVVIGGISVNILICSFVKKYDLNTNKKITKFLSSIIGRLLTLGIIIFISFSLYKNKINDAIIDSKEYPVQAAEWIKENLDLKNIKLYNEYNYGSYLLFKDIPVFVDSRADLYAPEYNMQNKDIFSDFLNISNIGVHYEKKFKQYGITHVICYKNAKINLFISRDNNYKPIYNDNYFVIYERLSAKSE